VLPAALQYAIGGGALPLYLVLFSDIATIMGAGNFIGHATSGFTTGGVGGGRWE